MRADGSDEHILTTSYLDEGPTWAPNGRVIMFSRETAGGGARLWTVDVAGRVSRGRRLPGRRVRSGLVASVAMNKGKSS